MVGVSNVTVGQLREAQTIVEVVSVQNRYSVGDRRSERVLEACERDGIAFLPWAPVKGKDTLCVRTLFLTMGPIRLMHEAVDDPQGRIEAFEVEVPGAGWP